MPGEEIRRVVDAQRLVDMCCYEVVEAAFGSWS